MEIVFQRRLTNELMTTYLPSLLLLLMSYATSFFKPFFFEAAVTVNLSILLVTTTLFIRSVKVTHIEFLAVFLLYLMLGCCLQCDGKASCNVLCSNGGYLAHIWTTISLHSGRTLFFSMVICFMNTIFRLFCSPSLRCILLKNTQIVMASDGLHQNQQTNHV